MAYGPIAPNTIYLGQDYKVQTLALAGGAVLNGSFRLAYRGHFTVAIAHNASAATVETAVRELPDYENATVAGSWVITANADVSILDRLQVYTSFTASDTANPPYITVAATTVQPLQWSLLAGDSVRSNTIAPLAQKTLIPGTSSERASQTKVAEWVIEDQNGGLGIRDYVEVERVDRFYDSSATTHVRKQLSLGFLEYTQTYSGFTRLNGTTAVAAPDVLLNIVELNGVVYGWFLSYNSNDGTIAHLATHDGNTTWTQKTLASGGDGTNATKAVFRDARVDENADFVIYDDEIWVFTGNTYVWRYSSTANTITAYNLGSAGVISGTVYDQKLIRLDLDGQLYTTTDKTSWEANAKFSQDTGTAPIGQMLAVRTFRNAKGLAEVIVYHDRGLHVVDIYTSEIFKIIETGGVGENVFPARSIAFFQGDVVLIAGNRIKKYDLSNVNPYDVENDQGLPYQSMVIGNTFPNNTRVSALFATNQWLLAVYRGTGPAWHIGTVGQSELGETTTLGASWRSGMVLGYNGRGWHTIVPYSGQTVTAGVSSNWGNVAWANDRLYYQDGRTMRMVDYSVNPLTVRGQTWATSSYHMTAWFDRGLSEIVKTAYHCTFRCRDLSSTNRIRVYYQLEGAPDYAPIVSGGDPHANWVPLLDHDGDVLIIDEELAGYTSGNVHGHFDYETLSDGVTDGTRGINFYAIRLLFKFERSDITGHETDTPILESATVTLDALFNPLVSWEFRAAIGETAPDGRTSIRQIRDANRLLRSSKLQPFAMFYDDAYMVHIDQVTTSNVPAGADPGLPGTRPYVGFLVSERLSFG